MDERMTLSSILKMTSSDKQALHAYGDVYGPLFEHLRERPVRFLEVGILGGDGLVAFSKFFSHPGSRFVGVDIHNRGFVSNDPRIETIYGDAGQAMFLAGLHGPFTIAIDDGSHFASHQITFFEAVWPLVEPGGILCIEDVHTVHSPAHRDTHLDVLDLFNRIAHEMQDEKGADGCAAPNPDDRWHSIVSIEHRKGLIIVRKRA